MAQRLSSVWVVISCLYFAHINAVAAESLPTSVFVIARPDAREGLCVGALFSILFAVNKQPSTLSIDVGNVDLAQINAPAWEQRAQSCLETNAFRNSISVLDQTFCAGCARICYRSVDSADCIGDAAPWPILIPQKVGSGSIHEFTIPASLGGERPGRTLRVVNDEKAINFPSLVEGGARPIFEAQVMPTRERRDSGSPQDNRTQPTSATMWKQNWWEIVLLVAVVLLQGILITALLHERRRRRLAEAATQNTMSELLRVNRMVTAGELSVSIAHEVNQPLAGIVANANAGMRWLDSATPDVVKAGAAFKQIAAAGHHASDVIAGMRALVSRGVEERVPLEINELIRHAILLERLELEKYHVSPLLELGGALPKIVGDRVQLLQVILNLVGNAIEAMEATSTRTLRIVSQSDESGSILVSVEDSGVGIGEEELNHVFDPFFTTKAHGLGIGLSICRSIIDSHSGQLWVTSSIGKGSIFHVKLPRYRLGDGWTDRRTPRERVLGGNGRCLRS